MILMPLFVSWAMAQSTLSSEMHLTLELDHVEGAKAYEVQAQSPQLDKTFTSASEKIELHLPVGDYKIRTRVKDYRGVFGEWSATDDFSVKPAPVDLKKSEQSFKPVITPEGLKFWVDIQWLPEPGASGYKFQLKKKDPSSKSTIEKIVAEQTVKEPHIRFKSRPGQFFYNVTALYSKNQVASAPSSYEPKLAMSGKKLNPPDIKLVDKYRLETLANEGVEILAQIEHCPFMGERCKKLKTMVFHKAAELNPIEGPGVYKVSLMSHLEGYLDSDPVFQEIIVKPQEKDLPK
jgi:hypothetical protein